MENKGFSFSKVNLFKVTIEGQTFKTNITQELYENVKASMSALDELPEKIEKDKDRDLAFKFCKKFINALFGKGAYEKIFSDRKKDIVEHTAVIDYIQGELDRYVGKKQPKKK
ncbi:MAG: hypothetical protein RR335_06965 [Eubacterium sp.]